MMTDEEFARNKDNMAPYTFRNGHTYYAFKKSALFCEYCTDIFYDSGGPYMFYCDKHIEDFNAEECLSGNCPDFVLEGEKET